MRLMDLHPNDVGRAAGFLRAGAIGIIADLRALTTFAQNGGGSITVHQRRLERAMLAFFAAPGEIDFDPLHARLRTPDPEQAPEAAQVVTVLRGARGRIRLQREHAIEAPDLAVLAGVDESYVRKLARSGGLTRAPSPARRRGRAPSHTRAAIEEASAISFLTTRGVHPWGRAS